ncbi:MAG: NADH-quinone oxidoreductase subunit J [Candidatus Eremiobacteraeota bacterium]|nr:NADH-quinone oxidoreductase subunit J [Candidatus Eremiobacteraeota bacterium]
MTLFWLLSVVLVASAVWTISASKPVYSVVALLLNFAALAFMYMTLSAEFIAVIQIIVYSGAILVLFVFVIALLSSGVAPFSVGPNRLPKAILPAVIVVLIAFGFLMYAVRSAPLARITPSLAKGGSILGPVGTANVFGSVADFGKALFTVWLLPFEATALILMVAVIGVVFLAADQTPYVATRKHAKEVERELREAILRGGE